MLVGNFLQLNIFQMKRVRIIIIAFAASLFLSACGDVYSEYQKVPDLQWTKKDSKTFEFQIEEEGNYDLVFALRYATMFPYKVLKIQIDYERSDGKSFEKDLFVEVIGKDGKYIGDVAGNMWDLEKTFSENEKLKPGKYKITYTSAMPRDPVPAVIELGLIVQKHKEDIK